MDQSRIFPQGRCFPSLSFLQNSLTLGKYSSIRTLLGQKYGGKVLCGNKNPNKLKRSIVVGQEMIQAGAELVEKEGGEGKKRNIFLSLCRDVNSQTGYISSYT